MVKTALITGAARRVGAEIARTLHASGMNIVLHHLASAQEVNALQAELEAIRPHSAVVLAADLRDLNALQVLAEQSAAQWVHLDCLINNAATFYPTPLGQVTQWDDLIDINLRAPFFLSQAAAPWLRARQGCIVNLVDIYADRPLQNHSVYSMTKAGLVSLTKSLANELAPEVRVNAVAPGAILWPEGETDLEYQKQILEKTPLRRLGSLVEIARAVRFLVLEATYTTGHVLNVDGGRVVRS
ncbi:pteridine reductase [Gammaproteobacteria bacterium]